MTALFTSRQRAERFSALVDGSPESAGAPDGNTERLVGVVTALRAHGSTDPSAAPREAFARELRERLMAEAESVLIPQDAGLALPARPRGKRERRVIAVATAAVVLGGSVGVATAAQSALPGEALYPVKRGIERAEVGFSSSAEARGHDLLDQASGRLDEVRGLLAEGPGAGAALVPGTVDDFTAQSREGAQLLLGSYQDTGGPGSVVAVRRFATDNLAVLTELADAAPGEAQADFRDAALALEDIDRRAQALCATCADLPELRLPPAFRVSAEASRALAGANAAKLDNSHPVVEQPAVGPATRPGSSPSARPSARTPRTTGAPGGGSARAVPPPARATAPAPAAAPAPSAAAPPAPAAPAPPAAAAPAPAVVVPSVGSNPLPPLPRPSAPPPVDVDVDGQQPLSGQGGVRHRLGGLKQTPLPETDLPEADVPDTRLPTDVLR